MEGQKLRVSKQGREAMAALAQLRDGDAALLYALAGISVIRCTSLELLACWLPYYAVAALSLWTARFWRAALPLTRAP